MLDKKLKTTTNINGLLYRVEECLNRTNKYSLLKIMPFLDTQTQIGTYDRLEKIVQKLEPDKSFYEELEYWLIKKHFTDKNGQADDAGFYHYAQIPKSTWNHLLNWSTDHKKSSPSKETVLKIVIGLGLTVEEAEDMMKKTSHCFEKSDLRDRVVMACLYEKIYNPDDVYEILKYFSRKDNGEKRFRNIYSQWEQDELEAEKYG